jgi:hypothetical protein
MLAAMKRSLRFVLLVAALLVAGDGFATARPRGEPSAPRAMSLLKNLLWLSSPHHHQAARGLPLDGTKWRSDAKAARELLDEPISGSAWQRISWEQVRRLALERLAHPERIAQGHRTLLCGPGITLNTIAQFNPLQYARLVREVYSQGTFNGLRVDQRLRRLGVPIDAPPGGAAIRDRDNANPLDWMMLSALRNAYGRQRFEGRKGTSLLSANLPREVRWWLQEVAGFQTTRTSGSFLRTFLTSLTTPGRQLSRINAAFAAEGPRAVLLLMDMKGVRDQKEHGLHWMRLVEPIVSTPEGLLKLTVFDHGANRTYSVTNKLFARRLLHVIVASPSSQS